MINIHLPTSTTTCSNDDVLISTLETWEEVEKYLINPLVSGTVKEELVSGPVSSFIESSFISSKPSIFDETKSSSIDKLTKSFRRHLSSVSYYNKKDDKNKKVINSLRYLFFHKKRGVFVKILNNKVAMFVPFVNRDYANIWSQYLNFSKESKESKDSKDSKDSISYREYLLKKSLLGPSVYDHLLYSQQVELDELDQKNEEEEKKIVKMNTWYAKENDGKIYQPPIHNQREKEYGNSFALMLDMLIKLCNTRKVPNVDFFIGDNFSIKKNLSDANDHVFPFSDFPLAREKYDSYAPICSFFGNEELFGDILVPSMDDWSHATKCGAVENNNVKWTEKKQVCYYCGKSTSPYSSVIAALINNDDEKGEKKKDEKIIDIGMLSNTKDYLQDFKLNGGLVHFIPPPIDSSIDKSGSSTDKKYLLYINDQNQHYPSLMNTKSVVFKVSEAKKDAAACYWYSKILTPGKDYISVKSDLSNLEKKIQWAKNHDVECMQISATALKLRQKFLSVDGILDYWQFILTAINKKESKEKKGDAEIKKSLNLEQDLKFAPITQLPENTETKKTNKRPRKILSKSEKDESRRKKYSKKSDFNKLVWDNYKLKLLNSDLLTNDF
jgi:hypothetical protein